MTMVTDRIRTSGWNLLRGLGGNYRVKPESP